MVKLGKIALSIMVVLIAMLAAAAGTELTFGELKPGFAQLITVVLAGPLLWLIWRKRGGRTNA